MPVRHGCLRLELQSIHSSESVGIPTQLLRLFKLSSHPAPTGSKFPRPEEWIFEEGERVTVCSSKKDARIAVGWVERIVDDIVYLLEYKEEGQ
jgi:hypothetical protein